MKKSMMTFALISIICLSACSTTRYDSNGVGCYVSNKENVNQKVPRVERTDFCEHSRFEDTDIITAQ